MSSRRITTADGTDLHTRTDGPDDGPPLVLCNSLGTDLTMWEPQVRDWSASRRIIRFDQRGHGRSSVPDPPYSVEQLGRDAVAVMDAYDLDTADVCGLSLGGMVALWLAGTVGDRLHRVVLADTAAKVGTAEGWRMRIDAVRDRGMAAVAELALARFFTPDSLLADTFEVQAVRKMVTETDSQGYIGSCQALATADLSELASTVSVLTLVVVGDQDEATPPSDAQALQEGIQESRLEIIADAGHLSNLEQPEAFAEAVTRFLLR